MGMSDNRTAVEPGALVTLVRSIKNGEEVESQHSPQTLSHCPVSHLRLSQERTSNWQLTPEKEIKFI